MGFDLASLLESKRDQSSESRARVRLHDELSERIPSWLNFLIVWQACQIDETLRRRDGFAVERRNAPGKVNIPRQSRGLYDVSRSKRLKTPLAWLLTSEGPAVASANTRVFVTS